MLELKELDAAHSSGGTGSTSFLNVWLDYVLETDSIASVADYGGDTKSQRNTYGIAATGDIANLIAVHIRNRPTKRAKWTYRHVENGHKNGNGLLATYHRLGGGLAEGIMLAEEDESPHFVGHVYPVSNMDDIHLKTTLTDGRTFLGEDELDKLMISSDNSLISKVEFTTIPETTPKPKLFPEPYQPALDSFKNRYLRIITPGSWEGSIKAVLEVPGVYQALAEGEGPIACFTNAVDIRGRTASYYLQYLSEQIGRKLDVAIINQPDFELPETYQGTHHFFVEPDLDECQRYTQEVISQPIAKLVSLDGRPTIRHDGILATATLLQYLVRTGRLKPSSTIDDIK